MKLAGDFHSHTARGSTVLSEADMKAWGGWLDRLGLARYVGLIVSPSPESGWMYGGRVSAWTVSRQGTPSRLVCEPARIAGE